MIKEIEPLSMIEAIKIAGDMGRAEELGKFVKKFSKKGMDFKALKSDLEALKILKLNSEHISKIIDILPDTAIDLNKIVVDVGLDEKEINGVLETVKKYL
jgi:DNA-directed RNA polymerase subunit F